MDENVQAKFEERLKELLAIAGRLREEERSQRTIHKKKWSYPISCRWNHLGREFLC